MYLNTGPALLLPLLFTLFWIIAIGFILWYKNKSAIARMASMEKLSQMLNLSFSPKDSFGLARQLSGFDLFKRERSRLFGKGRVTNVMRGLVDETEVYLFDYSYTVQAGNSRKRITQTVFFANNKDWYLPNFHLKPEKWWHTLQKDLGISKDINFEDNPEFSEKFWLKGEFEDLIREKFTPSLQGFLTEKPPAHMEGNNYYLIAYKPRKKLDTPEAQLFFQHCCEMVKMLQEKGNLELLNLTALSKEKVEIPAPEKNQSK